MPASVRRFLFFMINLIVGDSADAVLRSVVKTNIGSHSFAPICSSIAPGCVMSELSTSWDIPASVKAADRARADTATFVPLSSNRIWIPRDIASPTLLPTISAFGAGALGANTFQPASLNIASRVRYKEIGSGSIRVYPRQIVP